MHLCSWKLKLVCWIVLKVSLSCDASIAAIDCISHIVFLQEFVRYFKQIFIKTSIVAYLAIFNLFVAVSFDCTYYNNNSVARWYRPQLLSSTTYSIDWEFHTANNKIQFNGCLLYFHTSVNRIDDV
jgi:hypothetical protein